ncbi:MAG: purine-nucleoside phosphorylase [Lachnospiraceae bacterium]|nr:purine-nucleoside phosphorylase [Lachnospiraceae bacterium]
MNEVTQKLQNCYESVRARTDFVPKVAIVLGSGLGDYADTMSDIVAEIAYDEIEGFPVSTVPGHEGRYIMGYIEDVPVICMKGRVHYYEGYKMSDVVLPVRLMAKLGAKILFLTNASGGINKAYTAGDLMLIKDQISSFVPNPLIGPNDPDLGVRFPDMSAIYDKELSNIIRKVSVDERIPMQEGVYIQFTGPSYESPAEVRMAGILGADAVGMSTAVEAIAANHMGMRICGISCISNVAAGLSAEKLKHEDVQAAADAAAPLFKKVVTESIIRFGKLLRSSESEDMTEL